jgi:hypothetical protein
VAGEVWALDKAGGDKPGDQTERSRRLESQYPAPNCNGYVSSVTGFGKDFHARQVKLRRNLHRYEQQFPYGRSLPWIVDCP